MADILRYLNDWKKGIPASFETLPEFETRLLFVGLLHREMNSAHFDFDVEDEGPLKPDYFHGTLLSMRIFDILNSTLKVIAEGIPVQGEDLPSRLRTIRSISPPSPLQSISTHSKKPPYPKPKKKLLQSKQTAVSEENAATHAGPSRSAALTSTMEQSEDDIPTTPKKVPKKKGGKKVDVDAGENLRRSGREHKTPKRYDDSDSAETPAARGRGKGKQGRGRGKR